MHQSFREFTCYIADDLSTDRSLELVQDLISSDNRFILVRNSRKMYQPGNYDQIIRHNPAIHDDEIIVEVDGDDWLPDADVFQRINKVYMDPEIWIANGRFVYSDGRPGFSAPPTNIDNIRNEEFTASHIRTWRAFLWREIDQEYLRDETGQYWKVAGDLAFMLPMLEMSGPEHYKFMPEINYIYNEENPINDHKVSLPKVVETASRIRNKHKYSRLKR